MTTKIAVFDTKTYDREFLSEANKRYGFQLHFLEMHLNEETSSLAKGADAVCIFVNDIVSSKVVVDLVQENVRLIALRCAGYNNVDLKAAHKKIPIVRVPEYSPHAVAEHAVALLLTLNRKTHRAFLRTRENNFSIVGLMGFDLYGKTAGVIGTGKIGKAAAEILRGFGMEVLLYDIKPDQEFAKRTNSQYVSLKDLIEKSDVITLHCPLTPLTQHLIDEKEFRMMKDGVILINTGRGKLINTLALIEALKNRKIGAAGLDVYEEETAFFYEDLSNTFISDDQLARLQTFPNVLITSHQGFFTKEALRNIAETTLRNISDFFSEGKLSNVVNLSR